MKKNTKINFEQALEELETLSDKVENGNCTLDQLIEAYKRGSQLYEICNNKLNLAKLEIEKINSKKTK